MSATAAAPALDAVWSAEDTTPAAIGDALRRLLAERHAESESYAPARALNLVAVVEREQRAEILASLERAGRHHPSRTVICGVQRGRRRLGALATMACEVPPPGGVAPCRERVELDVGEEHLPHLDTVVDPLLVTDLDTLVWSPSDHPGAMDSLVRLADAVLVDSSSHADFRQGLDRAASLSPAAHVVDLSWLRAAPWRERLAAAFDPPQWRGRLAQISAITVRHHPSSTASGALLLGWLADRLGWETEPLRESPAAGSAGASTLEGRARTGSGEVALRLDAAPGQEAPGLAGASIDTASGAALALDRGPGGLAARRRSADGRESSWVVLGASRGEGGILGEGIRQALLRSPLYDPALEHARAMLG